jgi:GDP-6-deoxy-D-talose 4-dehydrogenase
VKLLLTGAQGFTGKHLARAAVTAGFEVMSLQSNICDYPALEREVNAIAPDVVAHLAAMSFVNSSDPNAFYEVNVIGTLNLLKALTRLPVTPQKILITSSAHVYGNCLKSPISETTEPNPINHYGASKLSMEHMARIYLDKLPLFFVRPFNYTGPGQREIFLLPKLVSYFAARKNSIELGNLNVTREFNDVRFVCEAYLRLLSQGLPGEIYNVCSGNAVSLSAVIELLSQLTQHSLEVKVNSEFVRQNEILKLYGNPEKLMTTVGNIHQTSLQDTLFWMLESLSAEENS